MSSFAKITTLLTTLFYTAVSGQYLKTNENFRIAECIWDTRKCLEINYFNPEPDFDDLMSEWPPGPYALPMSKDGCPETRQKGWSQGYIDFTWTDPHNIYSSNTLNSNKADDISTTTNLKDVTAAQLPDIQSTLIGPYNRYRVKLNFCFKVKRNDSLDRGVWSDGNYTIYGDRSGCPTGFVGTLVDIQIAKTKHWMSDGKLPHFEINVTQEDLDILQILQCSRKQNDGEASPAALFPPETPFILLPYQYSDGQNLKCADVADMEIGEEVLYIDQTIYGGNTSVTRFFTALIAFCYYFPKERAYDYVLDNFYEVPIPVDSFVVKVMNVTTGQITINTILSDDLRGQHITINDISNVLSESFSPSTLQYWKVLDLGKTMTVLGLSVEHIIDPSKFQGDTDREFYSSWSSGPTCLNWTDFGSRFNDKDFPDGSAEAAGNNCRDPWKSGLLYCMTSFYLRRQCEVFRWRDKDKFPQCLISAGQWDFKHFSALSCKYDVYYADDTNNKRFYMIFRRSVQGRYISLVGGGMLYSDKNILERDTHIDVLTNRDIFRNYGEATCNMNLGMSDDTILDQQISASSSYPKYPASSARPFLFSWCARRTDEQPYIMVKLIYLLKVEGITIWNWEGILQTVSNGSVNNNLLQIGARSFSLAFGNTADNVSNYDVNVFHLDSMFRVDEPQTFVLYKPVFARFVQIHVLEALTKNLSCLRFELTGCRTKYHSVSPVVAYQAVQSNSWQKNATVLSPMYVVSYETVLTSTGYPGGYGNGETYKWIIQFDKSEFIKLIFTTVSLNIYQGNKLCDDTITFNEELQIYNTTSHGNLVPNKNLGKTEGSFHIDTSYNGRGFMIETKASYLTLKFSTCQRFGKLFYRGQGFRAIVMKQDIPQCFSLDEYSELSRERTEICDMPVMSVSPMSYFNLKFTGNTEKWIIRRNKGYLRFEVSHFDVICDSGSTFTLKDRFAGAEEFCNLNRPPEILYTSSSWADITFKTSSSNSRETFRLLYHSVYEEVPETLTTKEANIPGIYISLMREGYGTLDNELRGNLLSAVGIGLYTADVERSGSVLVYKACSKYFDKCYSVFSDHTTRAYAGSECWIRQQRLVSIHSLEEMRLLKYILRNFKYLSIDSELFRTAFRHDDTYYYYAYIGSYRVKRANDGKYFEYWENTAPVTYSAWKHGERSEGDCARMGFYKANEDNSWEAVDCFKNTAFYFICEYDIANRSIDLLEDVSPQTYQGRLRYTMSGSECIKWPYKYEFYNETVTEASNYCRMPLGRTLGGTLLERNTFWCFIDRGKHDYCRFSDTALDRCVAIHHVYDGKWNVSSSGKPCSRWDTLNQTRIEELEFPEKYVADAENFCRDPTGKGFLWCYTSTTNMTWETCTIDYGGRNKLEERNLHDSGSQKRNYFTCHSGQLVHTWARCNGLVDCDDTSDEVHCTFKVNNMFDTSTHLPTNDLNIDISLLFMCQTNDWISFLALCDGVVDCYDASDEKNCSRLTKGNTGHNCSVEQFQCADGNCIHLSLVCNFINDCTDSSDEICDFAQCSVDEYSCASGQCISQSNRCDTVFDCLDGSDETNCESCSSNDIFHCDYVRCLPRHILCDNHPDCEDGSDEMSCDWSDIETCNNWWEIGYRETGVYTVVQDIYEGEIKVICDFSDVIKNQKIYTIYPNVDIMEWEGDLAIFTVKFSEIPIAAGAFVLFDTENAECTLDIFQSCIPALNSAWEADELSRNKTYKDCACIVTNLSVDKELKIRSIRYCYNNEPLSDEDMDKIFYTFNFQAHSALSWKNIDKNFDSLQLHIGPSTCGVDYKPDFQTIGCSEGRKVFHESVRCLYDTDRSQDIVGCRSGSHLQGCESYMCPPGTMKCPNSYCIPIRFVCDGKRQCTNGEDEKYCGCDESEREIVILQEDAEYRGPDITTMAKQLTSSKSVIRHILFKFDNVGEDTSFKHRLLRIRDKEIKPFEMIDREYECKYNVISNDFINVLKFSKSTSRALIFIQSSPISQLVADAIFGNITENPGYHIYRVSEQPSLSNKIGENKHVVDVHIKNWNKLGPLVARYLPGICKESPPTFCPNAYKCASSKMCITLDQVCDGSADCTHGDDEMLCNFICPSGCQCHGFVLTCDSVSFNGSAIPAERYQKTTRSLTIDNKAGGKILTIHDALDFPLLYLLNLSRCGLEWIPPKKFVRLINLRVFDISYNLLTRLSSDMFKGLTRVQILKLDGNYHIATIDPYTFQPLKSIRKLRIGKTNIKRIVSNTFADLTLDYLDVLDNDIEKIEEFGFGNMHVKYISFESNVVLNYDEGIFTGLSSVTSLRTPAFKFCCVRPNYIPEEKCFPRKDEFSSCEDLMRISALQTMLWLIGVCALLGNLLAVIYRVIYDRQRLKLGYGVFVTNLAVADFFMGIYMIIIAIADAVFRKRYIYMDEYWRNSFLCTLAGVLSTVSSEASVIFLCFITLDRLLVIKYPFGQFRFDTKTALICSASAWFFALSIALFPLMYTGYFKNKFYSKSGVCIALPLTKDRPPGWLYSVLIFICLNFVAFILIALGQWSIYMNIRKSRVAGASKNRKKDLTVSRNLLLVVSTDFLCWFPIGCVGFMAMSGNVISGDVYAWAAVFILPVNSALNPILYTLPAILGKKSLTPRFGEQSAKLIKTASGKKFLAIRAFSIQRVYVQVAHENELYVRLQVVLQQEEPIAAMNVLKISLQIADILRVLHHNSLVLVELNEDTVLVRVRDNQTDWHLQVNEPKPCRKFEEKYSDIYKMGQFLQSLVMKCYKNAKNDLEL